MSSSSADTHSQPKRPATHMARQTSASSQMSLSASEGHHRTGPHKRQHVVGHARVQRNPSFGKNLNKLTKLTQLTQAHGGDGAHAPAHTRHHRRNLSGNSNSAPSSPRPSLKRNASTGGAVRQGHPPHTHAAIRKNHSSGHLARHGASSKAMLKSTKSEIAPPKRSLLQHGKARARSPDAHPTVHFDIGDADEEPDDGWTEASASQSPTTTRSNTRSNSVILDPQRPAEDASTQRTVEETSHNTGINHKLFPAPHQATQTLPDRTHHPGPADTTGPHHRSRPPDADMITSRLLRRSSGHNPPPQMSSATATVVSDSHDARVLSQSAGSTLVDTPGRDLVSRFMDGDGSAGTPKGSSFLPGRASPHSAGEGLDRAKRNKSMPNVAEADTPSRAQSRRSGTSTPTDLPPSRTQQKLMLQRASSAIEPQKLIPAILPRTGAPSFVHSGMTYPSSGGARLDPRLQQQFNHVNVEYKVVRRYRDPLADAIVRIQQVPGVPQKTRMTKSGRTSGAGSVHGSSSLSASFNESTLESENSVGRRSRVSFENVDGPRDDGNVDGRHSRSSVNSRLRDEAEEVCRRLWESTEAVEGD